MLMNIERPNKEIKDYKIIVIFASITINQPGFEPYDPSSNLLLLDNESLLLCIIIM